MQRQNSFNSRQQGSSKLPVLNSYRSSSVGRVSARTTATPLKSLLCPTSANSCRSRSTERRMKKKDSRPITDKKWQAENTAKVQRYFQHNGASDLLNNGTNLKPMNLNMFVQMVNFIFTKIHPTLATLTKANYTELLPTILNNWEYPGTISTSVLKTANTMHSWPHILAVLSWLVDVEELLSLPCSIEQLYPIDEDASIEDKLRLYKSRAVNETFVLWNSEQSSDEYLAEHKRKMENILGISDDQLEQFMYQTEQCKKEYFSHEEKVKKIDEEIKLAEKQQIILKEDQEKCRAANEQYKTLCLDLKAEHNEFKRTIEKIKEDVEMKKTNVQFLKDKLSRQTVTVKDRDKILEEINELKRKNASRLKVKEHKQKLSDEKDLKLAQVKKNLEEKISDYNLLLIEPSLKYPELKELCAPEDGFMHSNIKEVLMNKIKKADVLNQKATKENDEEINNRKIQMAEIEQMRIELTNIKENIEKLVKSEEVQEEEFLVFADLSKKEKESLLALIHEKEVDEGLCNSEQNLETNAKKLQDLTETLHEKENQYKKQEEQQIDFIKKIHTIVFSQRKSINEIMKQTTNNINSELKKYNIPQ